ncbi:protein NATD1-like [Amphiura filiformis]|uniref:protein NATD1-like n=1 Tax=Amphiura filiformis TaxID=82378 RepID=UPI003B223014
MISKCTRSLLSLNKILYPFTVKKPPQIQLLCSNSVCSRFLCSLSQMASKGFTVQHDETSKEFVIQLDSSTKAYLQYENIEDGAVDLYHTFTPTSHRGQGIARDLAKAALDHFATAGTKMQLTCTYLQKYVKDNPNELYDKMLVH